MIGALTLAAFASAIPLATSLAQNGARNSRIVGVVADSVDGVPLQGAEVIASGVATTVKTDSLGRFTIDSLAPGTYQVGVFHPLLESLGITLATKPFVIGPDSAGADPGPACYARGGNQPTVTPRAMTQDDIRRTINDFATAAANAVRAGFDGVQLQAGFNYLISQFLNPRTNVRTDEYGGSIENRARFLFDVLDAVGARIDISKVGVKAGPAWGERGEFVSTADTLATSEYVIERLNEYSLAHLLLMGAMADLSGGPLSDLQGDGMFKHFRPRYRGTIIANVGMTRERGNQLIDDGLVDLVAFGEMFIANPDLPQRFAALAPIIRSDRALHYAPGPHGYTDYPRYETAAETQDGEQIA